MSRVESWRRFVADLTGWRRRGFAVLLGALTALAFAPVHAVPVLLLSYTGLIWLIDGVVPPAADERRARPRYWARAFGIGWWFGLGHFMAGLYWISFSFLVDAQTFAWMIPFAVLGISAGMAIYAGLSTLVVRLSTKDPAARILVFTVAWIGFEWVRGWALTGFPWNLTGTVWATAPSMMQPAAFVGLHGLGLLTILAAAAPAIFGYPTVVRPVKWGLPALAFGLVGLAGIAGALRLEYAKSEEVPNVRLRLVQPNIAQKDKWVPALRVGHVENLLRLSRRPAVGSPPTHIIWPETATPLFLSSSPTALAAAGSIVPAGGALITGAPRSTRNGGRLTGLWNSVHIINSQGQILDTYDKSHLVPFGEYVPFRGILGISKITAGRQDFLPGSGPGLLSVPGAPPVTPLVCYEVVFPGLAGGPPNQRPGWLLNLTNDAWFGVSSGPYQHLASAQFRAVEQGVPLIRVANTGISAVIDPYGRVRVVSKLNERTIIDSPLPKSMSSPTLYARVGDYGALGIAIIFVIISAAGRLKSSQD